MDKQTLIKKVQNTTSLVEFYKLKEDILAFLEPSKDIGKAKDKEIGK